MMVIGVCAGVYATVLVLLEGVKKDEVTFFRKLSNLQIYDTSF